MQDASAVGVFWPAISVPQPTFHPPASCLRMTYLQGSIHVRQKQTHRSSTKRLPGPLLRLKPLAFEAFAVIVGRTLLKRIKQKLSSSSSSPDGKYALRHVNSHPLHDFVQTDASANTHDQDTASQSQDGTPLQLGRYTACSYDQGQPVVLSKGAFCCADKYVDSQTGRQVAIKKVALTGLSAKQQQELANHLQAE